MDQLGFAFLAGTLNESKNCGLRLEQDLNLRPDDLDLRPKDLELRILESEDLYLPLWDLTTPLPEYCLFWVRFFHKAFGNAKLVEANHLIDYFQL